MKENSALYCTSLQFLGLLWLYPHLVRSHMLRHFSTYDATHRGGWYTRQLARFYLLSIKSAPQSSKVPKYFHQRFSWFPKMQASFCFFSEQLFHNKRYTNPLAVDAYNFRYSLAWKVSVFRVFLVHIFLHLG